MNKEELAQRRKNFLTDVFEHFQENNEFSDKKSFRVTRVDDWDLLDELDVFITSLASFKLKVKDNIGICGISSSDPAS